MNPRIESEASPRLLIDAPIEAFAAIVLRRLGEGYIPPRTPAICEGWVEDFRRTYGREDLRPIEAVFRADPHQGKNKALDAVPEGESGWPLFCIWRKSNERAMHTFAVDKNRVTVSFMWILPPHPETERIWPLLTLFDEHLRRILCNLYFDAETKALLTAAGVRDYVLPWQTYKTEQGYGGPKGNAIYPTLTGTFQFDTFWERNMHNHGLILEGFNQAYFTYTLKHRSSSGTIEDARLNPELASAVLLISQAEGANP